MLTVLHWSLTDVSSTRRCSRTLAINNRPSALSRMLTQTLDEFTWAAFESHRKTYQRDHQSALSGAQLAVVALSSRYLGTWGLGGADIQRSPHKRTNNGTPFARNISWRERNDKVKARRLESDAGSRICKAPCRASVAIAAMSSDALASTAFWGDGRDGGDFTQTELAEGARGRPHTLFFLGTAKRNMARTWDYVPVRQVYGLAGEARCRDQALEEKSRASVKRLPSVHFFLAVNRRSIVLFSALVLARLRTGSSDPVIL